MEWLACRPDIVTFNDVKEKQARARSFFWSRSVIFLNKLLVFDHLNQDSNGGRVEGEITFATLKRYNEEEARGGGATGKVPECKIEDKLEAVKPKVSNAMNKFVNVLRETGSNCAKQEVSSFENPMLCASGVTTMKTDSDKEEEEDEDEEEKKASHYEEEEPKTPPHA